MSETLNTQKPRIDGALKLSGGADYTADINLDGQLYGYPVGSAIASGELEGLELEEALGMPGVVDIFHHDNFDSTLKHSPNSFAEKNTVSEPRLPFEDTTIHYHGQYIALVVADTFEHARAAAQNVKGKYRANDQVTSQLDELDADNVAGLPGVLQEGDGQSRGEADAAYENAEVTLDHHYSIATETHAAMELHASTATWSGDHLTVYESTQGVVFQRHALSHVFSMPPEQINVISHFIGSGFGGKLFMWPHAIMTAVASRRLKRPVKTVVPRQSVFTSAGSRPRSMQRVRLGARADGTLTSIRHDGSNETAFVGMHNDTVISATPSMYACENVAVTNRVGEVNHGMPCPMRAPGEAPGLFALETAMDELAWQLEMDPVELRKKNFAERDPASDLPWSSNHLIECWDNAAKRFGWENRTAEIGAMREGDEIIGYGMASQSWEAMRLQCSARVTFLADGRLQVSCGTQDIGTGTYTIVAQTASELSGVPIEDIDVRLGDSSLPSGPLSGGSFATATVLPAVKAALDAATQALIDKVTQDGQAFSDVDSESIELNDRALTYGDRSIPVTTLLEELGIGQVTAEASAEPGDEKNDYSFRSFGAVFVEVRWDPGISRLKVERIVSTIDIGRAINPMTARNQVEGGLVMGLGMALFEQTEYDKSGYLYNANLADYIVPVHADIPPIDVELLDYPDYHLNAFGARGVGEIGLTGIAAAISNAVYHATGKRIRDLPISIERLLMAN
ncbi:xanthine dehydrogenase family protein molybdopterin-binding subunit [Larsenimonas suaedae]|uniref:Xanthine dehydrogenase family protein molybdopterin-binding subunit n=1 Tax=Larsenimonas suaedae TaxID=1851019 RepID=A0ABU1GS29_9GAMM|nr:xanthine dehydrogenase family protein molybdopterin-binding subunit [Larsenimonas suaedae]MCM2972383.1 xanthine dehydrogenase family protein molybdopterin-binding subunit [Larsenimonas suaedae]MDR5894821.1 xanthine dehydrogenase family protein molybdopterin-binding subunit [Larsenimonas suaedae]